MQLAHIKNLSMWEIAHYWHCLDPRASTTHKIPLAARDTLTILSRWCCNSVSYRIEKDNALRYDVAQQLPRLTARHFRKAFHKAIDTKIFSKKFFSGMFISRSYLARMCIQHNEPLPLFWYPDNEKYPFKLEGDISDETTEDGRFKLVTVYDDRKPTEAQSEGNAETVTVSSNAVKAAQAKHAAANKIKDRFNNFFDREGHKFSSRKAAASHFFDSLPDPKEQYLFTGKKAAVDTLCRGYRDYLKHK